MKDATLWLLLLRTRSHKLACDMLTLNAMLYMSFDVPLPLSLHDFKDPEAMRSVMPCSTDIDVYLNDG